LNLAVGYNATGMTGARVNRTVNNGIALPQFERAHYFVLSPDIDITRIKSNRKAIVILKEMFGFVKIPMPAIRLKNNGNVDAKGIYF
jgi:hypothetical protein